MWNQHAKHFLRTCIRRQPARWLFPGRVLPFINILGYPTRDMSRTSHPSPFPACTLIDSLLEVRSFSLWEIFLICSNYNLKLHYLQLTKMHSFVHFLTTLTLKTSSNWVSHLCQTERLEEVNCPLHFHALAPTWKGGRAIYLLSISEKKKFFFFSPRQRASL